jgi:kynurenine formamidase
MIRASAFLALLLIAAPLAAPQEPVLDLARLVIVDLTHAYNTRTVSWPTSPTTFALERLAYGRREAGYFYAANAFCTPEHGGTHLDAPIHFDERGRTTEQVPLEQLVATAVVIDVSRQAAADRNYRLTRGDVLAFEASHGRIAAGTIVLLRTGWSRHWPDAAAYLGDATRGEGAKLAFPGFGTDAARLLVEERRAGVLGVDTASIDYGPSPDFQVHRIAAGRNVPALENLTNLDRLPATGSTVLALPMKIEGGSGGPVRAIALLPR